MHKLVEMRYAKNAGLWDVSRWHADGDKNHYSPHHGRNKISESHYFGLPFRSMPGALCTNQFLILSGG